MRVPRHQILTFVRSGIDPQTYHLTGSRFKTFVSVTIKKPYAQKMLEMGAKYILTGFNKKGEKTIFTALFAVGGGWYQGDRYTPNRTRRSRLILINPTANGFTLYYFNNHPKTAKKRLIQALK